ncbi:MAG: quinolinate synthase NadA [Clostridia bacterium]|nr:quinolinate synthase NadA [Clostridia bacterium]
MKDKIKLLKKQKNAVILAHIYTPDPVQEIADFVGDSFYLAKIAKESSADIIVFCGVLFMGESAKILNPDKKVLMPDLSSDCPMAHMVDEQKIAQMRDSYDNLAVVCYINSTAEIKALSDVCVTSSNAVKIVSSLPNKNIFFIPDKNLGQYIAEQVPDKNIILNDGYCPYHNNITPEQVLEQKNLHPNALVLSHPECTKPVLDVSDFIGSTQQIINYAKNSSHTDFIICTESGVLYQLSNDSPDKNFYFVTPEPLCPDMKKNTLQKILDVLQNESNNIQISEERRNKALAPLDKMLELST